MWHWCVMVVVMTVMSHLVAASNEEFMLTECRVEGFEANFKFTTYNDNDNVTLHLTRERSSAIPVIVIRQDDNNEWRFLLHDVTKLWKWEDVELQLSEKPKVFLNGKPINATGSQEDMKRKMWEVEIDNAWAYARCQKKWPVLKLESADSRSYFDISRSGLNEKIKLLPIEATNVRLSVGEQEKMLCQDGDEVVVKDYDPTQACPNLKPNTFTEVIDITVNDNNKSIKIRKEGLTGVLYIVHCVDDCVLPVPITTTTASECEHSNDEIKIWIELLKLGQYLQQQKNESAERQDQLRQEIQHLQQGHDEQLQQLQSDISSLNQTIADHHPRCYENRKVYLKGDFVVNDNCSISECHQGGYFRPYQATGARATNVSFSLLLAKNCVHLDRTSRTWDNARANCVALGGDLFVAGDLPGAIKYRAEQRLGSVWVGVKAQAWSDGRFVNQQEWKPGQPDGGPYSDKCGDIRFGGVGDYPCTRTFNSLCQKGVRYGLSP